MTWPRAVKINKGDSHATEKRRSNRFLGDGSHRNGEREPRSSLSLLLFCYIIADKIPAENKAPTKFLRRGTARAYLRRSKFRALPFAMPYVRNL